MRTEEEEKNQVYMRDVLGSVADDGSVRIWCLDAGNGWGQRVEEDDD